ncbi:hypothetical protein GCM10027299_52990 [Larkinella ripae]
MSDPSDKLLHDWVRQTLDPYRPAYDPADWVRLQKALRRRRQWRIGGLAVFLLCGLVAGWLWTTSLEKTGLVLPPVRQPQRAKVVPPKPLQDPVSADQPKAVSSTAQRQKPAFLPIDQNRLPTVGSPSDAAFPLHPIPVRSVQWLAKPGKEPAPVAVPIAPPDEIAIRQQMLSGRFGPDSTSHQTLTRNSRRWTNAVLVCDFTSSMYPYSTQLFAWMKKNARNPALRGLVLFTDCDSLGRETQAGGPAGQMFVSTERDPGRALPVLLEAARNTANNANEAENDIEALLFAQKAFPNAQHLILVADMDNPVKDMALLAQVQKPVHVILCGRDWDTTQAFHPDYYTIARQTNGSLHTLEDDLDPANLNSSTWLRIENRYYRFHRGKNRFVLSCFHHRPQRFLGVFWW